MYAVYYQLDELDEVDLRDEFELKTIKSHKTNLKFEL